MKLHEFIAIDSVVAQLVAADRNSVVTELIDSLVAAGAVSADLRDDLIKMIIDREKRGSTGFGKGVAVPHAKHKKIEKMVATIGISQEGVDFNALDKGPVYSIFLLLSPEDRPDEHLQAMENIFGHLQNETFRRFLRQSKTVEDVRELIHDADAQHLQG